MSQRIGTNSRGSLHFKTSPDGTDNILTRMTIDMDGDVGIGITNPTQKLDVDGKIRR